jgi:hypothetical protein
MAYGAGGGGFGAQDMGANEAVGEGVGVSESGADLAGALADALAGANVDDFGSYAEQDIAIDQEEASDAGDDQGAAMAERQALADRISEIDAAIAGSTEAGWAGPGTTDAASNPFAGGSTGVVEDFTGGNPYAEQQIAANEFADWGAPTPVAAPTVEETQMGMTAPIGQTATAGTDFFGGPPTAPVAFSSTAGGTPGYAVSGTGTGVEDFTGPAFTGTMGQGGVSQNIGMIGAGTAQDSAGTVSPSGAGMINMGSVAGYDDTMTGPTTYGEMDEGTLDPNAGGVSAPAASPAGTDFFGDDGNVGQATDSPAGTRMTEEGLNVYGKSQIDKSIMDMSAQLMAKAKADPNGRVLDKNGNPTRYTNQRAANVFNSLDQYSKAYAATQGGSFLGSLIEGAVPFGAALKGIQGWLTKKGMYSKQTGDDLFAILQQAMQDGDLNQVVRDLGGGGPTTEDVEGPKEISAFIEQYPWASELDPKYIKYLIDNPAALQDLLGQGPGGV